MLYLIALLPYPSKKEYSGMKAFLESTCEIETVVLVKL